MDIRQELIESINGEQATGCPGAGDYRQWAREEGYPHLEIWDWTSSAGDWTFLVSKDRQQWYMMTQTNNYPGAGFTRQVDTSRFWIGDFGDVCNDILAELGAWWEEEEVPERWIDSHSVTCAICGRLYDERDSVALLADGGEVCPDHDPAELDPVELEEEEDE